jgi:hypothetical protein
MILRTKSSIVFAVSLAAAFALSSVGPALAGGRGSAGLTADAVGTALAAPGDCPQVMAESAVHKGMVGTGWTVVKGHVPKPFKVKVLGILKDGVIAGKDIIMVRLSDAPGHHFIARAGGGWAGISGSPVYFNGKLAGSTSWGFTGAPSPIMGLTPAQDIVGILSYTAAGSASRAVLASRADRVTIPPSMQRTLGISSEQAQTFGRMPIPFVVSGLGLNARTKLQDLLTKRGMNVIVVPGGSRTAPQGSSVSFATPRPGGNFAGLLSYGDFTAGGIGTTTYVCHGVALAFGHPLNFVGQTDYAANNAGAISIVRDNTFGDYKLANVGAPFGRLDQDRISGIRTQLGELPSLTPITSHLTNLETGLSRSGETDSTTVDFASTAAANHLYINLLDVLDAFNGGTSFQHWVIRGTDGNGDPWQLEKSNRFASQFALPFDPADNLFFTVEAIASNPFEAVHFTSIEINGNVSATYRAYSIDDVQISKNGGAYQHRNHLSLTAGDQLSIHVALRLYRGGVHTETLSLTVPAGNAGVSGALDVLGGASDFSECFFDVQSCASSLPGLLNALHNIPRNDVIKASLDTFGGFGGLAPTDTGPGDGSTTLASDKLRLDTVVGGQFSISFDIH